jgi:hypothetical protein
MINPSGALQAVDSMAGAALGPKKDEKKDENDNAASEKKSPISKALSATRPNQPSGILSSYVGSLSKGLGNFVNEKFNPFFIGYNEKREPVSVVPLPKVLGSGSSVLGSVVNQAFSGMVNMVITAVPQAIFDRHKTVVGKFGASLSRSAKEQGRELAKSALKAIFNNEGVVSLGESLGLDKYSLGGDVSKSLDSLNAVLSPFFDRLLDDWLGSSQPPRLRSMNGLGGVIGLTLTEYLTGSVKQADILEIMWRQRQLTQQNK